GCGCDPRRQFAFYVSIGGYMAFFFSSRRRHTSFSRDWSSDVCSSDLGAAPMAYALWQRFLKHHPADPEWSDRDRFVLSAGHGSRSEERRVGKERSSVWCTERT